MHVRYRQFWTLRVSVTSFYVIRCDAYTVSGGGVNPPCSCRARRLDTWLLTLGCWKMQSFTEVLRNEFHFHTFPDTLWVRKEIKFGYSCSLCQILHSWYRQSSFLHSATPRARDGLSVSLVQDFAEKALLPKLDSYNYHFAAHKSPKLTIAMYRDTGNRHDTGTAHTYTNGTSQHTWIGLMHGAKL